jgi:hypothetical protein
MDYAMAKARILLVFWCCRQHNIFIAARIDALFFVVIDFSLLYILPLGSLEVICLNKSR